MPDEKDCNHKPASTVYGPVPSWRFGQSLGIDPILETSTCSFNCIYCQLGNIQHHTAEQRVYVPTERVIADLRPVAWDTVDIVAISGSGEPTLATNLGEIIAYVKDTCNKPVLVLTNSVHLKDAATRERLRRADIVACKLDAANDKTLRRMNRPVEGVTVEDLVQGIEALRDSGFPGKLVLQCMLMPPNRDEVKELAKLVRRIGPAELQLNTPRRPYPREWYLEARGDHAGVGPAEKVPLKTVTLEEAQEAERIIKDLNPGLPIVSVYRTAPEK